MPRLPVAGIWTVVIGAGLYLLHEVLPSYIKDELKSGLSALVAYRKHKRQLFMLKAIAHDTHSNVVGHPFTLHQIEQSLTIFQIEQTYGGPEMIAKAALAGLTEEENRTAEKNQKRIRRLGIPDAEEAPPSKARLDKIESILQQMVRDGKLRFIPPDSYAVV